MEDDSRSFISSMYDSMETKEPVNQNCLDSHEDYEEYSDDDNFEDDEEEREREYRETEERLEVNPVLELIIH